VALHHASGLERLEREGVDELLQGHQLFELDKDDYISFKTKEHEHQLTLQGRIGADLK
jgi:hypothetical protein